MIQAIQTLVQSLTEFFTSIGYIITSFFESLFNFAKLVTSATNTFNEITWFFPAIIAGPLFLLICLVCIYKILGRT